MSTATQATASVVTRACRDAIPVVLAYAPFGLALGATLAATRIPPPIAWSSSPLLFSGAAQLLAVQLLDAGASVGVVVLGALVVNARMLLYGAGITGRAMPGVEVLASMQHVEDRARALRTAGVPGTWEELKVRATLDLLQERGSRPAPGEPSPGGGDPHDPGSGRPRSERPRVARPLRTRLHHQPPPSTPSSERLVAGGQGGL